MIQKENLFYLLSSSSLPDISPLQKLLPEILKFPCHHFSRRHQEALLFGMYEQEMYLCPTPIQPGPAAKAGAAEQSKASDRAEPAKVFFIFIVNTPFLF